MNILWEVLEQEHGILVHDALVWVLDGDKLELEHDILAHDALVLVGSTLALVLVHGT